MESNYLKYLITEEVYVIDKDEAVLPKSESKPEVGDVPTVNDPAPSSYSKEIPFKGNNSSATLIFNFENEDEFISDQNLTFLKNILSAVKLDIDQVALVNLAKVELDADIIVQKFSPKAILGFGVSHIKPFNQVSPYKIATQLSCKMLLADDLKLIESDKSKKKALWGGLQELFLK